MKFTVHLVAPFQLLSSFNIFVHKFAMEIISGSIVDK